MSRIVREHYPVERLPEDLREGLAAGGNVRVTIEADVNRARRSLEEIFAARLPPFRTADEIDADLRSLRDEWDRRE